MFRVDSSVIKVLFRRAVADRIRLRCHSISCGVLEFWLVSKLYTYLGSVPLSRVHIHTKNWGSLSLPSRFNPDLRLFRTFGVDLSTSPGCGCIRPSPCVGPVGIEPTWTRCKSSGLTARQAGPHLSIHPSLVLGCKKLGDRSASPPDSSLIWGSSGHSGWM